MIVVGTASGEREQHKFRVQSRHVDLVKSECGKVTLASKRSIIANRDLRKCRACFGHVIDYVAPTKRPQRGGKHRKE